MKKPDWISASVALLLTGIGYYAGGPKWAAVCIAVGVTILVIIHLMGEKKTGDADKTSDVRDSFNSTVKDSGNATASAVGNKIEHHVHYHSPEGDVNQERKEPERKSASSKPIIEFSKARLLYAVLDEYATIWRQTNPNSLTRAVVAPFYYHPKSPLRAQLYVRAHIVITDKGSDRRIIVPSACWLEEDLNHVVMVPGDEKCVLIMAFRPDTGKPMTCLNEMEMLSFDSTTP